LGDRSFTYAELDRLGNQHAHALAAVGVGLRDRVVMWSFTDIDSVPMFVGLSKLGAVFAPANALLGIDEATEMIGLARPAALAVDEAHRADGEVVAARLGVPLVQLGNRAYCEEERDARKKHRVIAHDALELVPKGKNSIRLPKKFPSKVFFTVDVDGIDPSVLPATGTPVPGGLGWYQTLGLFESVARQRKIIGFDVMEFAPIEGFHAFDFAAALLTYKLMGIVQRCS